MKYLIGIDEAGRGPLAGPVAVGVFAVRADLARVLLRGAFRGVKDSKQLSESQREEWFARIRVAAKNGEVAYAVGFARAGTIDGHGLTRAINSAMNRALLRVERQESERGMTPALAEVRLDGSLYAPARYKDQTTIIDGDALEPIIALASICAKVLRDGRMKKLARNFPHYGFEIHKGYGTKAHYAALKKHGMCLEHRRSFLKKLFSQKPVTL